MRTPQRLLPFLAILALIACSSDSGTNPVPTGPTTDASATIKPTGGSISVENEHGVSFKVSLPSGAVLTPTKITLKATDPPAGVRARFVIQPAGLNLNKPVTFTVKMPDGATLAPNTAFVFTSGEPVHVPADIDPIHHTLTASMYQLGFNLPASAALASTARVARGGENSEFIDVDAMECDIIRDALTNQVLRAQAFSSPFPPDLASPLIQEYKTALLLCESDDSVATAAAALREYACNNIASVESQAQSIHIETVEDLKQQLGFILAAEAMAETFGGDCSVETATIEGALDEYLNAYIGRINAPEFTRNFPTWDALWRENLVVLEVLGLADRFEVFRAQNFIKTELSPALFARLREVAHTACVQDENNSFLLDIVTGGHALNHALVPEPGLPEHTGFTQSEIVDEMMRCGGSIVVEAKASDNLLLASATINLSDLEGGVRVTDNGKIVLTDDMLGFTCRGIVSRPPITVRAEVPEKLPKVPLGNFSGTKTINVGTTLTQLPAPEEGELPSSFDIVIERARSVCNIEEPGTIEVCRIHVNATGFLGSMTGLWSGNCPGGPVSGTFVVEIHSDRTVTGGFDGSATGGITGTVSANGTFDATANGTAGSCTWSGALNLEGAVVNGSGTWSCGSAGCSGEYHSAPLP
jgi:uncharacterized lipoprotein YbaY